MLRILRWLSVGDAAATLHVVVLFLLVLLLADQKLLGGPAKLAALHFPVRRFDHDGRQAVLQLAAAVEVGGVGEYLEKRKRQSQIAVSYASSPGGGSEGGATLLLFEKINKLSAYF